MPGREAGSSKRWMGVLAVACTALVVVACSSDDDASENGSTSPHQAYLDAGCGGCHGDDGEGAFGPPLGGHTDEQIVTQIRDPRGSMPAFDEEEVSEAQLELIVEYIEGLEGEAHHHDDEDVEGDDHHHDDEDGEDGDHHHDDEDEDADSGTDSSD